jgi:hypothetical protein
VTWRTLMDCSVFCSLKVYLPASGVWTMNFLPAFPSANARRTSENPTHDAQKPLIGHAGRRE